MKKTTITVLAATALLISAFQQDETKTATLHQYQGLYVFIMSKPTQRYESLGVVKKSFSITGQPSDMIDAIVKKAKKDYPNSEAVIFTNIELDRANVIKFLN